MTTFTYVGYGYAFSDISWVPFFFCTRLQLSLEQW
jgi:hypothetical protein